MVTEEEEQMTIGWTEKEWYKHVYKAPFPPSRFWRRQKAVHEQRHLFLQFLDAQHQLSPHRIFVFLRILQLLSLRSLRLVNRLAPIFLRKIIFPLRSKGRLNCCTFQSSKN